MTGKLTKEQIAKRLTDLIHNKYEHGGSRVFINGESGDRQLLVDTYYDCEFADYIEKCTREYFSSPWISVQDRLPELPGDYLGYIANPEIDPRDHQIQVCYLSTRHGARWIDRGTNLLLEPDWNVTHWMPLPKLPQE